MVLRFVLKALMLPPLLNIILVLLGLWCCRHSRLVGFSLIAVGLLSLFLLSTAYISNALLVSLEKYPPLLPNDIRVQFSAMSPSPQAIVVLGTGNMHGVEYGALRPDYSGQQRLDYAAFLHRRSELPIMVTGNSWHIEGSFVEPHGRVAARYLQNDHGISARWVEVDSLTTWENAEHARNILQQENINTVVLVTQSVHMRRSVKLFQRMGFSVVPAPTDVAIKNLPWASIYVWGPSGRAFALSRAVLYEYLGLIWYSLR